MKNHNSKSAQAQAVDALRRKVNQAHSIKAGDAAAQEKGSPSSLQPESLSGKRGDKPNKQSMIKNKKDSLVDANGQPEESPAPIPLSPGAFCMSGINSSSHSDHETHVSNDDPVNNNGTSTQDIESQQDGTEAALTTQSSSDCGDTTRETTTHFSDSTFVVSAELVIEEHDNEELQVLRQQANAFRSLPVAAVRQEEPAAASKKEQPKSPSRVIFDLISCWKILVGMIVVLASLAVALVVGLDKGGENDALDTPIDNFEMQLLTSVGLKKFQAAAEITNLWGFLNDQVNSEGHGDESFTILAPIDDAWNALPFDILTDGNNDGRPDFWIHTRTLLLNHVIRGTIKANALLEGQVISTIGGASFRVDSVICGSEVDATDACLSPLFFGSGALVVPDLSPRSNVLVHGIAGIIDTDFLNKGPIDVLTENILTTTVEWAEAGGILPFLETLRTFTSFAVTNEAVEAVPHEIRESVKSDPSRLFQTLLDYTLDFVHYSEDFVSDQVLISASGDAFITSNHSDDTWLLTRGNFTARIVRKDLLHRTGVTHILDAFSVFH